MDISNHLDETNWGQGGGLGTFVHLISWATPALEGACSPLPVTRFFWEVADERSLCIPDSHAHAGMWVNLVYIDPYIKVCYPAQFYTLDIY